MMVSEQEKDNNVSTTDNGTLESGSSHQDTTSDAAQSYEKSANIQDPESTPAVPDFPEGGWRAWACVAGSFCVQMVGFGYTTSFGVYQDYYTRFYITKENPSTISWIGSVNAFIVISAGVFSGRLYDKGYFYHIIYGASALIIFSLFMLSLSKPDNIYQNFLAQGVGHGLGAGFIYVPSLAVISHHFLKRRALAMSIVAAGSSLGAIIHPIMLNNLFIRIGFHKAVLASAGMNTGLLIIACLLMRTRLPPPAEIPPLWKSLKKFAKDGPYVAAALGLMVFPIGMYYPLFYLQLDAVKHGLSPNFAFYSLVILNGASFTGRLSPGLLVKYIPVVPLITIMAGAGAVLIFGMAGISTVAGFVVFGLLYGFCAGAVIALMAPLTAVLSDDLSELGLRMGYAFLLCGFGALIGPPVQGALVTKKYIWWRSSVFAGVFATFSMVMFGVMMYLRRKKYGRIM